MNALNIQWLQWIAAGGDPATWPLFAARAFALWGAWACGIGLACAAWRHRHHRPYMGVVVVGAVLMSLLSHAVAAHFNVQRPFVAGWVPAYIPHAASAATPSTHATVMFFVAFALVLHRGLRWQGVVAFALACIVGWARIYVGVHFPLDIGAGLLLGAAAAVLLAGLWAVRPSGWARLGGGVGHRAPLAPAPARQP